MRAAYMVLVVAGCALSACREGVSPYVPPTLEIPESPRQLTFGSGQDNDPRWSPGGDSVLYHTSSFGTLPRVRGVLLTISPGGGAATPVIEDVQRVGTKLLATPAYAPDAARLAYVDLLSVESVVPCSGGGDSLNVCPWSQPLLDSARLRVRAIGETRNYTLDPTIVIKFAGTDPRRPAGDTAPFFMRAFPFQVEHRASYSMLFRPSWAPDGQRIVYSDGLSLRIWRVGEPTATTIPGTTDGVSPAWSADGQWIAFTRLVRGDSIAARCNCSTTEVHDRVVYPVTARQVVLVRPDGSDQVTIGEGEEPAWSPDGNFLYVRRGTPPGSFASEALTSEIVRLPRAGGAAVPIPHTTRGRAPAVSPDGRWLAYARAKVEGSQDYDIWLVALP